MEVLNVHTNYKGSLSPSPRRLVGTAVELCQHEEMFGHHLSPDGSGSHARSRSFRARSRSKEPDAHTDRPRRNSMPSNKTRNLLSVSFHDLPRSDEKEKDALRRVRSFKTTSKGAVVNRGDSFKQKHQNEVSYSGYTVTVEPSDYCGASQRARLSSENSSGSGTGGSSQATPNDYFRVVILGAPGVGKTALTQQFMTSEYLAQFDTSNVDREESKTVTVLLDGEESTIEFINPQEIEVDLEDTHVDAYLVVISVTDRKTFEKAVETIQQLRNDVGSDRTIILVANKIDVVRKRLVSAEESRKIATKYDCKFAETSAVLSHHVDELLVGILSQIRLKLNPNSAEPSPTENVDPKKRKGSWKTAKGLLNKLFGKSSSKARACDNLHQL